WSLMDSGNLAGARVAVAPGDTIFAVGLLPPSVDPFQRNFILDQGLLNFREPGSADTAAFALLGSQRTNDYVKLDLSSDEYVILENRFLSPASAVRLLQDDTTHVVLGPRDPDPWQARVAPRLSDGTIPSLIPNQGTRPHMRVDFLDDATDTMHVRVTRTWQPKGWPVKANFPPGGPDLLAADLDRDGKPEA